MRLTQMKESSKTWRTKMTTMAFRMTIAKMSRNTLMTMAKKLMTGMKNRSVRMPLREMTEK